MTKSDDDRRALDDALVRAAKSVKVLSALEWPKSTAAEFLASWEQGRPQLPRIEPQRRDLAAQREALAAVMARCDRGHGLEEFIYETAQSYLDAIRMVDCVGTREFSTWSMRLYGSPSEPVAENRTSTLKAAERLMDSTRDLASACRHEEADYCVMPERVADELRRAALAFGEDEVEIVVDCALTAKAAAGAHRIRIRGGTCFSEEDIPQLVNHELLVHTLTALNGRRHPGLQALGLGPPRTTQTQEGLALFAELITNSIDINRLRRIASRCIAIHHALEGADFIEVFRFFLETGQTESESFASAQRVFRGGDVRGGVAFTKDAVYLQGFVRVHGFLRTAIHEGNVDYLDYLVAGRLHSNDVAKLAPYFASGRLMRPAHRPPWLVRRSALVAFLLHSSFMSELQTYGV